MIVWHFPFTLFKICLFIPMVTLSLSGATILEARQIYFLLLSLHVSVSRPHNTVARLSAGKLRKVRPRRDVTFPLK